MAINYEELESAAHVAVAQKQDRTSIRDVALNPWIEYQKGAVSGFVSDAVEIASSNAREVYAAAITQRYEGMIDEMNVGQKLRHFTSFYEAPDSVMKCFDGVRKMDPTPDKIGEARAFILAGIQMAASRRIQGSLESLVIEQEVAKITETIGSVADKLKKSTKK